jgi:hypothetical protein
MNIGIVKQQSGDRKVPVPPGQGEAGPDGCKARSAADMEQDGRFVRHSIILLPASRHPFLPFRASLFPVGNCGPIFSNYGIKSKKTVDKWQKRHIIR